MRVLRPFFGFEHAGFGRAELFTKAFADIRPGLCQSLVGDAQRVSAHVGDQTGRTHTGDVDALVQLLRHGHGAPRCHGQFAAGFLLQGRRDKGRRGLTLFLGLFHSLHDIGLPVNGVQNSGCLLLVVQVFVAHPVAVKTGQ